MEWATVDDDDLAAIVFAMEELDDDLRHRADNDNPPREPFAACVSDLRWSATQEYERRGLTWQQFLQDSDQEPQK